MDFLNNFLSGIDKIIPFEERFDLSFWENLSGNEKNIAINALINAAEMGNPRALMTLGDLGDKRFLDIIKSQTHNTNEWVRLCANRALIKLGGSNEGLLSSISQGTMLSRFASVLDLSTIPGEKVENALLSSLEDPHPYVRSMAMDALIERFGLQALTINQEGMTIPESPLYAINILLLADLKPLWMKGAWEAQQIFNSLRKGSSSNELNLHYVRNGPDNFRKQVRDSFFDLKNPFDLYLIQGVKGHDRYWAEIFLSLQLETKTRNLRAVEILKKLKIAWVIPALEASCDGLPQTDDYYLSVQEAISFISI
jgi:hypothetical protein